MWIAQVAELVDAIDSKSIDGNIMRVRFSPWAQSLLNSYILKLDIQAFLCYTFNQSANIYLLCASFVFKFSTDVVMVDFSD